MFYKNVENMNYYNKGQTYKFNLFCIIDKNLTQMSRGYRGITNQQSFNMYTYNIRIMNVKMKVKFQCKMKIELDTQSITNQVSVIDGCNFVFNQDCSLSQKNASQDYFILNINLITSKGTKYIAGLAYLYHQELARAVDNVPNSRIVVTLAKCLDPEAVLQIIVRQSFKIELKRHQTPARDQSRYKRNKHYGYNINQQSYVESRRNEVSPSISPRGQVIGLYNTTRSQVNLNLGISRQYKGIGIKADPLYQINKSRSKSKKANPSQHNLLQSGVSMHQNIYKPTLSQRERITMDIGNDKFLDKGSAYKQSYSRLKQKLKKQERNAHKQYQKRVNLQASDTNSKLEALKLQLKCQQLQKNVADKNGNIKKLQTRIEELQKLSHGQSVQQSVHYSKSQSNPMNVYLRQYPQHQSPQPKILTNQNQSAITILESKVGLANRQLQQLRDKMAKMSKIHVQKQSSYEKQIQRKNQKIIKLQQQIFSYKNSRLFNSKSQQSFKINLQSKQKTIYQLERQQDNYIKKLSQLDKANKILQKNSQEVRNKVEELKRNLNLIETQKHKLSDQIQSQKNKTNMLQLSVSTLRKNQQRLQNQLQAMQKYKQKYHDSLVQIKKLQGQRKLEKKGYESTIKLTNNNMTAQQHKHKQQLQSLHKKLQQYESRSMNQIIKIKQLQSYANSTARNQIQNYRKMNEKLQKDCDEYRNSQRMMKKQLSSSESRNSQLLSQVEVWKNKHKSLQNVYKLQTQKYMNQLSRLKASLQQQHVNQLSIKQKNQHLFTDLSVANNKLIMFQQKYNRQIKQLDNKLEAQSNKNSNLLQLLKKQQQINFENKQKEKELMNKLEQFGYNQNQYSDILKKYQYQLAKVKGTLSTTQDKLGNKIKQIQQLSTKLKDISQKYNNNYQKIHQLSYQLKNTTNQLQKQIKQKQKLEIQFANIKIINQNKQKVIERQKNNIDQEIKNKQLLKQDIAKANSNLQSTLKEYQRFREHVYDVLMREFTGVDGLESLGSFMLRSLENKHTLKQSLNKSLSQADKTGSFNHLRNSNKFYSNINQQFHSKSSKTFNYQSPTMSQYTLGPSTSVTLNNNDIINTINLFSKQSKSLINRMIQQFNLLQNEFEYYKKISHQKQTKYKQQKAKSQQNLNTLKQQITKIFFDKQNLERNNNQCIHDLQQQNFNLKNQIQKLNQKLQQSTFTCNGLKMEKETQQQFYEMKISQFTINANKLEQTLDNLTHKLQKQQEINNKLKTDNDKLQQQCKKLKQQIELDQKNIRNLQNDLTTSTKFYQQSNSKNKLLIAQISQLQMLLSNERQKNGKNMEIISQEEKKMVDTKDFINNLIKQKQAIVKQEIANGQKIIQLESAKINLQVQIQHVNNKHISKANQLQAEKENNRKLQQNIRQLQSNIKSTQQSNRKLTQQLKHTQKQLSLQSQTLKSKQLHYKKQLQNKQNQLHELNSSKQLVSKLTKQQKQNLRIEIQNLQQNINKLQQQNKNIKNSQIAAGKQLQHAIKNIQQKNCQINNYQSIQQQINRYCQKLKDDKNTLTQQLKQKQQKLYEVSGQLYALQLQYQQILVQHKLEKQNLQEELGYKYDNMCQDYETRIDQIERERDYLKQKLVVAEEQLAKNNNKLKQLQQQQYQERVISKNKLVQSQQQKNTIISNIKLDLKRMTDLKDRLQSTIKKHQLQIQKLKSIETSDKNIINKLQNKLKQLQKILQQKQQESYSQLQKDKRKQLLIRQYEQKINNYQWSLQREIKKQLHTVIKSIVNTSSHNQEDKRKITDVIKDVENKISKLIAEKIVINNDNH